MRPPKVDEGVKSEEADDPQDDETDNIEILFPVVVHLNDDRLTLCAQGKDRPVGDQQQSPKADEVSGQHQRMFVHTTRRDEWDN